MIVEQLLVLGLGKIITCTTNKNAKPPTKDELADNCRHDGMW
ncbi:hypothetical protein [Nostoc sp. NMS7]|nr:hypothetical protein [Nostoc sp. NMS7]